MLSERRAARPFLCLISVVCWLNLGDLVKESINLHSKLLIIKEKLPGNSHYEAMPLVCALFCFKMVFRLAFSSIL